ncbi:uncharacterized protein LOC124154737 isoform X2 [Ischnura elegans]|uniref:uncharacterized protein LOC124154737 isoform X2 n=1 Tax=Ischnura elegans TaxID=197161 RepID=UPI001ED86E4A|nr:uncharacterized protein LOC124154737 isoform X2 [Ischnura elegans]
MVLTVGIVCAGHLKMKEAKKRKRRQWWTRPWLERRDEGIGRGVLTMLENELVVDDPENYRNYLRMSEDVFMTLLNKVEGRIKRQDTNMRQCIPARKRLAVTLRFLATGETFKSLSFSTRIAHNTLSKIIPEVLQVIIDSMREYIKIPTTPEEWKEVSRGYEEQWNFPHCLGSVDGNHNF